MGKKCLGCGIKLQNMNASEQGFVLNLDQNYCKRCHALISKNQKYESLSINELEKKVIDIIDQQNKIILIVDVFNLNKLKSKKISDLLKNKQVLILINKIDVLPKSFKLNKIKEWIKSFIDFNYIDILLISAKKNYNIDNIIKLCLENKFKKILFLGFSNSGKSLLYTKFIKALYPNEKIYNVSSKYLNTTQDIISYKFKDFELIDLPGLFDENSMLNNIDEGNYELLLPDKEIKPIILQNIKNEFSIFLDNVGYITNIVSKDIFSGYFLVCNNLTIWKTKQIAEEFKKKHSNDQFFAIKGNISLKKHTLKLEANKILIIDGLGWLIFRNKKTINLDLYLPENVEYIIVNSFFRSNNE